jgi:hypothetical protein
VEFDDQKILFWEWEVKEEFTFPICRHFPAKFADFGLNYCISTENPENSISGRKFLLS